jgi:gamma-glutamyl-gamma-aminobutyrate hydrolase PuuD
MKTIIISQRIDKISGRNETRDSLDQRLASFVIASGFMPIPIPNSLGNLAKDFIQKLKPAGFILSGGNDIGDFPERDQTEKIIIECATLSQKPLLGICRGMQMMAVHDGTGLKSVEGHVATRHPIISTDGDIYPSEVNSFHNFALIEKPKSYEIKAVSPDQVIEAISHQSLRWEGWMWHPERETNFNHHDLTRFKRLFGAE